MQGGFQKCRDRGPRGWRGCRQKCREVGTSAGMREAYSWQRSLARCRSRTEAVNKAAQAPLVLRGGGQGHQLGSPQGRDGPKAAPNRKKSLGMWGRAPHLYTPKLMTQEAMMMRTPPTSATMLKSLATRPRRWAPSTSPCCRLFRDMTA